MTRPTLLLFDIDGTILSTNGVGRTATNEVFARTFGGGVTAEGVPFSGKTDPQIFSEVLAANGLDHDDDQLAGIIDAYTKAMQQRLQPSDVTLLPGVRPLLHALADDDRFVLGLLTGNVEAMAYFKLRQVGLDGLFAFGAFGSDHADRYCLPPVALEKGRAHTGHAFTGTDLVIIGDTEHDVLCGRDLGARSVAVCTGRYGREELAPHGPDLLLDDLADPAPFMAWLTGDR